MQSVASDGALLLCPPLRARTAEKVGLARAVGANWQGNTGGPAIRQKPATGRIVPPLAIILLTDYIDARTESICGRLVLVGLEALDDHLSRVLVLSALSAALGGANLIVFRGSQGHARKTGNLGVPLLACLMCIADARAATRREK